MISFLEKLEPIRLLSFCSTDCFAKIFSWTGCKCLYVFVCALWPIFDDYLPASKFGELHWAVLSQNWLRIWISACLCICVSALALGSDCQNFCLTRVKFFGFLELLIHETLEWPEFWMTHFRKTSDIKIKNPQTSLSLSLSLSIPTLPPSVPASKWLIPGLFFSSQLSCFIQTEIYLKHFSKRIEIFA